MIGMKLKELVCRGRWFFALLVSYALIRIIRFVSNHTPIPLPDSPMYLPPTGDRFGHVSLIGNQPRPFNITFLYAVIENPSYIVLFQFLLSTFAWLYLIYVISFRLKLGVRTSYGLSMLIFLLGLSGPATYWDLLLQSDSLAFSSAIISCAGLLLSIYRRSIKTFEFYFILIFTLSACMIRPFCIPLLAMYIISQVINARHSEQIRMKEFQQRNKFKKSKSARKVKVNNWQVKLGVGLLAFLFSVTVQNQMDLAWGKELAQTSDIKGRSLQQLGVVQLNPFGAKAVTQLQSTLPSNCTKSLKDPLPNWWGGYVHLCTDEARILGEKLQPWLLRAAIMDPVDFFKSYYNSVLSSFANIGNTTFIPDYGRMFFGEESDPTVIFGANWNYDSVSPIIIVFYINLLLLLAGSVLSGLRKFLNLRIVHLSMASILLYLSLFLTAYFSPSDTTRVSSAPMISFMILVIFWLWENIVTLVRNFHVNDFISSKFMGRIET